MNTPFEEIHCILNLESKERIQNCQKIFDKYGFQNVIYTYTFNKPFYNNIENVYTGLLSPVYDEIYKYDKTIYNRVFDVAYNHYCIIKSAYKRNIKSILIFEDDINFIVDKQIVQEIFNLIPNDYDIIKFYNNYDEWELPLTTINNIKYINDLNNNFWSCKMYALSNYGMKSYIDYEENNGLHTADGFFKELINLYNIKLYRLSTHFIISNMASTIG